jgi:uncharacterized membrane protein
MNLNNLTDNNKPSRLGLPDFLKGVAVVLMVQVHLMELFATTAIQQSMAGKISLFLGGPAAAPLFMAVMGYFQARSAKPLHLRLRFGLKLILWGFLLNIGLNAHLLLKIANGSFKLDPWAYLFGVDILFLAGLSVIFITLFRHLVGDKLFIWIILFAIVAFINPIIPVYSGPVSWIKYIEAYFWGYHSWSYFPFFPWLAYTLAGYVFGMQTKTSNNHFLKKENIWLILSIAAIPMFIFFSFGFRVASNLSVYYHHSGWFVLWTLSFLIVLMILSRYLMKFAEKNLLIRLLKWMGQHVTAFYVFQWLIIGNVATAVFQTMQWTGLILWFVLVMLTTSILVFLWEKLKRTIRAGSSQ